MDLSRRGTGALRTARCHRSLRLLPLLLACVLLTPSFSAAEINLQLPDARARRVADWASWGTAAVPVALDFKASLDCPERGRCLGLQAARIGATYGAAYLAKLLIHRRRPCAPDCGIDPADQSFFSAHTALAFQTVGGPRLAITLPFAVTTGGLRVLAGKHWVSDTLVGAGVGLALSRIR